MPSKTSTSLTPNPTGFFTGASETVSAAPSSLAPLAFHEPGTSIHFPGFKLFMETQSPDGQVDYWISLKIPGTAGGTELPADFTYRLLCFYFLSQLPKQGLQEAAESLGRMWEFYRVPFVPVPALPPLGTQVFELGQSYVRPTFQVNEDE
jgi:hypothetical protein